MPARKSNVSTGSNEDAPPPKSVSRERDDLGVEDLNLPKSIVQRLAKGVLPPNTQIQKDALLAMSKSATVFVNYLTSCAAETAQRSGKRTIMPQDVFAAMKELEFEFMLTRLEAEVTKFTSIQSDKRNTYRKKVREEKKAANATPSKVVDGEAADDGERAVKRAKRESGEGGDEEGSGDEADGDETLDVEDEEVEDDEIEEDVVEEGLTEDPLEEREDKTEDEDEEMGDGDESD